MFKKFVQKKFVRIFRSTKILAIQILRGLSFGLSFLILLRGPNWGLFLSPEICAFTGLRGEISSTVSKVFSDRTVLFKHKMAVNSR